MNITHIKPDTFTITVTAADMPDDPYLFDDEPSVTYVIRPFTDADGLQLFDVNFDDSDGLADSDTFDAADFIAQFGQHAFDTVTAAC